MHLSISLIAASAALSHAAAFPRQATNLGSWTFTKYTTESVPSVGVMTRDLVVLYSGQTTPVTCHWSYVPRNNPPETSTCSDPKFSYSLGTRTGTAPNSLPITVKQTVTIDNSTVTITGTGFLDLRCGQGAGFSCQGSGSVTATDIVA